MGQDIASVLRDPFQEGVLLLRSVRLAYNMDEGKGDACGPRGLLLELSVGDVLKATTKAIGNPDNAYEKPKLVATVAANIQDSLKDMGFAVLEALLTGVGHARSGRGRVMFLWCFHASIPF